MVNRENIPAQSQSEKSDEELHHLFEFLKSGEVDVNLIKKNIGEVLDSLDLINDSSIFASPEAQETFLEKIKGIEKMDESVKEQILAQIDEAIKASDEDEFKRKISEALAPILKNNPLLLEDIGALIGTKKEGFKLLNERISYGVGGDTLHLHLSPAYKIKERVPQLFQDGCWRLAEIVKQNEEIKQITCTSWIIATRTYGAVFEELGFTIKEVPDEIKQEYFKDEKRPMKMALMTRDEFLKRYQRS
jgi:hypothetical protein